MSPVAARSSDLIGACLAGCEALVHPRVTDAGDRRRHARLVCSAFTCALVAALAFTVLLPGPIGPGAALFAISAILGLAAGISLLVATTGSDRIAAPLSLAVAAGALALLLAAAGGLASPVVLFAAALLIEPAWVARTRAAGGRVIAVGTTVVRLLESAARADGRSSRSRATPPSSSRPATASAPSTC